MKKIYLLLLVLFSSITIINAQKASEYYYSVKNNVALENMLSGSEILFNAGAEEMASAIIDLPFTFKFANVDYQQFSVGTNGLIGLGSIPVSPYAFDFQLIQSWSYPILSPWSDVLTTGSNGSIKYKSVTLSSGLKKLVIEWNVRNYTDDGIEGGYNKTFQAWLFEGSNKVQFVYGNTTPYGYDNSTIGIAASKTDYEIVNSSEHTMSNSIPYTINGTWPGLGKSYSFGPTLEIIELAPITILDNGSVTHVSCNGLSNGAIMLGTINGGDGNYTINWTGPNGAFTGQSSPGLAAGVYQYTITDGSETPPLSGQFIVSEPSILSAAITSSTNVSCFKNGSINVSATGGTAPYTYGVNGNTNNNGAFTDVPAGSYTVTVTDSHNCITTVAATIAQPASLTQTITVKNATCAGEKNGEVTATATGGTAPFTYTISGTTLSGTSYAATNTSGIFNSLSAGNYVVTVKDAVGCTVNASAVVAQPKAITSVTNATCYGASNGSATVTLSGATSASYIIWYNSKNKIVGTGASINNLPADTYTVIAFNLTCPVSAQAIVSQPQPVTANATVTSNYNGAQISCSNSKNGIVKLTAAGGSGQYSYTLYTSANNTTTNATGVFANLAAGTYSYIVKDRKGCNPVIGIVKITAPTPVTASIAMSPAYPFFWGQKYTIYIGYGAQSVTLNTNATGGTPAYSYSWSPSTGLSNSTVASPVASPTVTTTYKVTIADANGCTTTKLITVNVVNPNPAVVTREAGQSQAANMIEAVIAGNASTTLPAMKVNVYPNPSSGQFNVQLTGYTSAVTVAVISESGKTVAQQVVSPSPNFQKVNFNLANQASGLYIIKITSNAGIQTSKIILSQK